MSKQIIKDKVIVDHNWQQLADDNPLPNSGNIIVSLQRWQQDKNQLQQFDGQLGIIINTDTSIDAIENDLNEFKLVAIEFKEFKDGRGYSLARLLRERFGFRGEIRAIGNILRDQIYYLHRCGFNAFELDEGQDIQGALKAFSDFKFNYQPAVV